MNAGELDVSAQTDAALAAAVSRPAASPSVVYVFEELDRALLGRFHPVEEDATTDLEQGRLNRRQDFVRAMRPRSQESADLAIREFLARRPGTELPTEAFGTSGSAPSLLAIYSVFGQENIVKPSHPQLFIVELHKGLTVRDSTPLLIATWRPERVALTLEIDAWGKIEVDPAVHYIGALFRTGKTPTSGRPREFLMDGRRWFVDPAMSHQVIRVKHTKLLTEDANHATQEVLEKHEDALSGGGDSQITARIRADRELQIGQLLGELASCQETLDATRARMNSIVSDARSLNVTWTAIGEALNIRGATAYQRFTERGRDAHRQKAARQRTRDRPHTE